MDYLSYERPVSSSGVWVRKAIPWAEEKPSKRHSDRKITHVYECLVNKKHKEYFSDHTSLNIWLKCSVITIVSPLITLIQTIYHLVGLGVIEQLLFSKEPCEPLTSRCLKELKQTYLVPFYGICQTILALGFVICSPFNQEVACNLRRLIGRVQQHQEAEKYFANTFQPICVDELKNETIHELIKNSLQRLNRLFKEVLKVPLYKSPYHTQFVDQDKNHLEDRLGYYYQSHSELFRLHKKDHRTKELKKQMINKMNTCYQELMEQNTPCTSRRVVFNLEKNEIKPISPQSTYELVKRYKNKLRKSHIKYTARKKRFLAHTLDEVYQNALQKYGQRLVKNSYNSSTIRKLGKMVRKRYSTILNNFQNACVENEKFLPDQKITKATKKLRNIIRSSSFPEIVKNDLLFLEQEKQFLSNIRNKVRASV